MTSTALTLNTAAKTVGKSKATILKAINTGRLSASKNDKGNWMIEPIELHRVYPVTSQEPDDVPVTSQRLPDTDALWRERLADLERERSMMAATIEDLRRRLDNETEERKRLMLMLAHESPRTEQAPESLFGRLFGK